MFLMETGTVVGIVVGIVAVIVLFVLLSYKKVRPNKALIITGPRKQKIVVGKGAFVIPFLQRSDEVTLDLIQTDIKTGTSVPTKEFIDVFVDGVASVRIKTDEDSLKLAGQILLSRGVEEIKVAAREVLEGNMREIVGQMNLVDLVQNREKFSDMVKTSAELDMERMGLEIINITIQNFSDQNNVIKDLGIDNVTRIRKEAAIAKANNEKEISIAVSRAKEEANNARVEAELKIAYQDNELALKVAALKEQSDRAKAAADVAYKLEETRRFKEVNIAYQEAEIAKRDKEIELETKEVEVAERKLEATVKKSAEAEKYAAEQKAEAQLFVRLKEAQAKLEEQKAEAEARKISAISFKEAELARSEGILAVGNAEAEAIRKKAEAMNLMEDASKLELVLSSKVLPEIVAAAAKPLENVDRITLWGEGGSTKLVSDIMATSSKVLESVKESTGIDLSSTISTMLGVKAALPKESNEPKNDKKQK
ncbi:flotillin family protein [Haploplasma axanthum]|uniref:Inner membrane protein yqiK n=1 Tax=Haploplasma axanthum TaxID=29552 RepID=A0A449BCX8_HAPAX|nr:flotillin family protein [Haploplasma axanthum]VEU80278.1 Inner membrane protein yqiK [Haploplasma axanthum]